MFRGAVVIALCSLALVIPTLTWRNNVDWEDEDGEWFQSDDPMIDDKDDFKTSKNDAKVYNQNGASFIKHMFHYNSIMQLNGRINDTLSSSYTYLTIAFHFDRADIALPGFHKFMMEASEKEKDGAMKLMKYMNKRGGWFKLRRIAAEERSWSNGLDALQFMLEHEKMMNANFLYTIQIANESGDGHMSHYIEEEFVVPRVKFVKKIADYISQLKSFSKNYHLGEYILDEQL